MRAPQLSPGSMVLGEVLQGGLEGSAGLCQAGRPGKGVMATGAQLPSVQLGHFGGPKELARRLLGETVFAA